jgi:hypothetical protein
MDFDQDEGFYKTMDIFKSYMKIILRLHVHLF